MSVTDFTDPGFYEYLLLLIGVFSIILVIFMIGVVVHTQHSKIMSIANKIRARGPSHTIHFNEDGSTEVIQHKTPDDIRQEIADEYGLTLDQVQYKIDP